MKKINRINPLSMSDVSSQAAEWLKPIPWQLFATLEFPWKVRPETANAKFSEMIDSLERSLRTRIGYLYALECRSKSGAIIPPHFHAAFCALKPIPRELLKNLWYTEVGRTGSTDGDLVRVECYDPAKCGIGYIVKQISETNCEWALRNIEFFDGNIQVEPTTDHASLRAMRRFKAQAKSTSEADGLLPCTA